MAKDDLLSSIKHQTTKSGSMSLLLPPTSNLLPSSGRGGQIVEIATDGNSMANSMARTGEEAKEFASRAMALAIENAPELKKKLQETGSRVGDLASKTLHAGSATAQSAAKLAIENAPELKKKLQETGSRVGDLANITMQTGSATARSVQEAMAVNRKKVLTGMAVVAVVLGGGVAFAKHQANVVAKDQVNDFLAKHNLGTMVSYDHVSGSLFGSASIHDVKMKLPSAPEIKVATITVANITQKNGMVHGLRIAAEGLELPLRDLLRNEHGMGMGMGMGVGMVFSQVMENGVGNELLGLGYTVLAVNQTIDFLFDDKQLTFSFKSSWGVDKLGSCNIKIDLGSVDPTVVAASNNIAQTRDPSDALKNLANAQLALQSLTKVTLSQASFEVNNSGYFDRTKLITNADLPPEEGSAKSPGNIANQNFERRAGMAGMTSADAKEALDAINNWLTKGGTIRMESNLTKPIPLFKDGNFAKPSVGSLEEYLVITRSKLSS